MDVDLQNGGDSAVRLLFSPVLICEMKTTTSYPFLAFFVSLGGGGRANKVFQHNERCSLNATVFINEEKWFSIMSTILMEEKACLWIQSQYSAVNINENQTLAVGSMSLKSELSL